MQFKFINLFKYPMFRIILILALGYILIMLYVRYFERSQIFHPTRVVDRDPMLLRMEFEDIYFKTEDGVKLHGWYIPYNNAEITVLYCHGNAGNIADHIELVQILHQFGVNVFIFGYRGYGKSEGKPSEIGTYRDAMAAFRYLTDVKNIPENKIIIFGRSLGGAVAIDLASKTNPMALISESAFTSIDEISRELFPFLPIRFLIKTQYDSLSKIKNVHSPVLIAHSRDDEIIGFHHAQKLFDAANQPKELLIMRGSHNDGVWVTGDDYEKGIYNFIRRVADGTFYQDNIALDSENITY